MQVHIAATTASTPLSANRSSLLLEVPSGARAGRRAAIFLSDPGTLQLAYADRPYRTWSTPVTLTSGVAGDSGFTAVIESSGDIVLVYIEDSTFDVVSRRLTFTEAGWQVNAAVTVYTGDVNSEPSLAIAPDVTLWVSWSRLTSPPVRHIHVKSSADGAQWGTGPSDPGDVIHSGGVQASPKIVAGPNRLHVVYCATDSLLRCSREWSGGSWSTPETIASGAEVSSHFDAAVRSDGLLAVAWIASFLYYREYDGAAWSPLQTIERTGLNNVQLSFHHDSALLTFTQVVDTNRHKPYYLLRIDGSFDEPVAVDARIDKLASVFAYHAASGEFADLTDAAGSAQAADMAHPNSGRLLAAVGDRLFLGMDRPFRFARLGLSTPGAGGTISFSYWDGTLWRGFTPHSGVSALDTTNIDLRFWLDYQSIPVDWQKCAVDGDVRFWIKIEVLSSFTTGPIGSVADTVSDLDAIRIAR
ncbi:hypothetical protein GF420_07845 [candidate division GN15 bacterium]|nr:hypothetical protein [candidate division GN15 bacterium]